jgi:hypothetical protein
MIQRKQVQPGFTSATPHHVVSYPGTAKVKRKRRHKAIPLSRRLLAYVLGSLVTIWVLRKLLIPSSPPTHAHYRIESHVAKNVKLYEKIWREKSNKGLAIEKRKFQYLGPTYGADVSTCDLTVLFMDPRIADPNYPASGPAWFALESLAAYAPKDETCVLLMTHYCAMRKHMYETKAKGAVVTEYSAQEAVRDWIYSNSLPLLRELIHRGRVRVSFVDVEKYQLKWCDDFGDPTPAFLNIDFWNREFIKNVDSDVVLIMQDDAVLCQELDVWNVAKYAYVGSVWPKEATELNPFPEQGMCRAMPGYWKSWLAPQRKWRRTQDPELEPAELLRETFPEDVCEGGKGPVGNGGFSIRQRSWMQTAIATCPHAKYSGIDLETEALACKVLDQVNEDVYFSVILRGLDAPLPMAAEAALFGVESLLYEDVVEMYGGGVFPVDLIKEDVKRVHWSDKVLTLPIGLHKPYWYLPSELLLEIAKTCPYLKYIYDPKEARYEITMDQLNYKRRWRGRIGT